MPLTVPLVKVKNRNHRPKSLLSFVFHAILPVSMLFATPSDSLLFHGDI
jgi:hypothetical protein